MEPLLSSLQQLNANYTIILFNSVLVVFISVIVMNSIVLFSANSCFIVLGEKEPVKEEELVRILFTWVNDVFVCLFVRL